MERSLPAWRDLPGCAAMRTSAKVRSCRSTAATSGVAAAGWCSTAAEAAGPSVVAASDRMRWRRQERRLPVSVPWDPDRCTRVAKAGWGSGGRSWPDWGVVALACEGRRPVSCDSEDLWACHRTPDCGRKPARFGAHTDPADPWDSAEGRADVLRRPLADVGPEGAVRKHHRAAEVASGRCYARACVQAQMLASAPIPV